jgi:hypothetical protein
VNRLPRISLVLLPVLLIPLMTSFATAAPVTPEMARKVARAFLLKEQIAPPRVAVEKTRADFAVRNPAAGLSLGAIRAIADDQDNVLAYAQELEPEGFIITAADDTMRPVLGFSFEGKFPFGQTKGNPLLNLITTDVRTRIRAYSEAHDLLQAHAQNNRDYWAFLSQDAVKTVTGMESAVSVPKSDAPEWDGRILLDTEWDQGSPFSNECPDNPFDGNNKCVVGCVATAFGQILNYWQFPNTTALRYKFGFHCN